MTRWGKAGERLNPDGTRDEKRLTQLRHRAGQARATGLADDREAYQRWRGGLVIPDRITLALDMCGLHGPEVDIACGAAEPEVDQWEAGERYPSWEQLRALAALTGCTPRFFTIDNSEPIPVWKTSMWHTMGDAERAVAVREWNPVMRYPRAVLDARPDSPADMPDQG